MHPTHIWFKPSACRSIFSWINRVFDVALTVLTFELCQVLLWQARQLSDQPVVTVVDPLLRSLIDKAKTPLRSGLWVCAQASAVLISCELINADAWNYKVILCKERNVVGLLSKCTIFYSLYNALKSLDFFRISTLRPLTWSDLHIN